MKGLTRYEREQLVIVPGDFSSLPDTLTTKDLVRFLGKSNSSVSRIQQEYNYLFTNTRPRIITKENFIKILNKSVPTDKEIRRNRRNRKELNQWT